MPNSLKSHFLLDPDVIYLNHGSAGACPRPVFEVYQQWQRELEHQPIRFIGRCYQTLLADARATLAAYVGAAADDLVYFTNPTAALNMAAHSLALGNFDGSVARPGLPLQPGDEILTTNHEYGAMDNMWAFIAHKTGARYIHRTIPLPVATHEEFIEIFWAGVTARTKVVYLSHITSPTALIFPITEICRRAREAGILSIVDGAHAPGQVSLNLRELGADVYVGACHKWLCAPKGAAFLYARPEAQRWLEPLVISRGWGHAAVDGVSPLVFYQEGQGTRDVSAFLAVPAAIRYQAENDWGAVRVRCHALASKTLQRITALTGLAPLGSNDDVWLGQFVAVRLPDVDPAEMYRRLNEEYRIEAPVYRWNGQVLIRVSFQGYNDQEDADALVAALGRLLPELSGKLLTRTLETPVAPTAAAGH